MKIVVLSPHRDDAAFSLGLAIDHWLAQKHDVTVLNCFTESQYAPYSDVDLVHQNDQASFVTALRRREDLAWSKLLGNKLRFHDLTLMDAPLRLACPVEDVLTVEIRPGDRAVARVGGAVRKLASAASGKAELAIVAPLALGGHIDHRVVHRAALDVLTETTLPVAFYEDLPYAAWSGVEEWIPDLLSATGLPLQPTFAEAAQPDPTLRAQRKTRMCNCYDSQVDSAVIQTIAAQAARLGGREQLWANPAWTTSTLQPTA